ncbi:unnamed protein product, partial [Meganyctiphanes norvegica]
TGSSRSYINSRMARLLSLDFQRVSNVEYEVRTFLGAGTKKVGETSVQVFFPSGRFLALPIFIDKNFELDLEVRGLKQLILNLKSQNIPLGADYSSNSDKVQIDGLIGSDLIQFIQFSTVPCMHGQALCIENKLSPFGNSAHFFI